MEHKRRRLRRVDLATALASMSSSRRLCSCDARVHVRWFTTSDTGQEWSSFRMQQIKDVVTWELERLSQDLHEQLA